MKIKFVFLLIFPFFLFANDLDQEIVVPLSKESNAKAIYVACNHHELKKVLLFDLKIAGGLTLSFDEQEEDAELKKPFPLSPTFWKQKGYAYVLNVKTEGQTLYGTLFSLKTGAKIPLPTHHLRKALYTDRRIMHEIADLVYEECAEKKGIAQTQIYYALQLFHEGKWKSEIWMADYDGKNARQLTEENSYCIHPTLFTASGSFTNNHYLYVNYKLGQPKIFISTFDQKKGTPFLNLRGNQLLPSFSQKGDMLAFICDASGQADLFLHLFSPEKGLVGKPLQLFSSPSAVQASPTFRPDGKKLAFVSDHEGTARIYLISIPSLRNWKRPQPTCLTHKYRENTCPSWSPDGTKLAYSAKIDGIRQIMVYDFITREEMQLTTGKKHKENPCWAPNSTHLIFNTADPSSSELFLINLKQKEMVQITEGQGRKHYPTWGQSGESL